VGGRWRSRHTKKSASPRGQAGLKRCYGLDGDEGDWDQGAPKKNKQKSEVGAVFRSGFRKCLYSVFGLLMQKKRQKTAQKVSKIKKNKGRCCHGIPFSGCLLDARRVHFFSFGTPCWDLG
jgi:hypothetical protein